MSDDVLTVITVVFYLVAVPVGIGAFTRGATGLAVLAVLALAIPTLARSTCTSLKP